MAEDDEPARLEHVPLADDPEGVALLEQAVGRIEEDDVEGHCLVGEVDDGTVEFPVQDDGLVLGPANVLQPDIPLENIVAFYDTAMNYDLSRLK